MQNTNNWLGGIFERLTDLLEGASKPFYTFVAVAIPYLAPYVMAKITAKSLISYYGMDTSLANILVLVFEGIGVVGLSGLVVAIVTWIKSKNAKTKSLIWLLAVIDFFYFLTIVLINVILDASMGTSGVKIAINTLLCLLPLLSGGIYGHYRITLEDKDYTKEQKEHAEKIRLEKEAEKQRKWNVKRGILPNANVLNSDTSKVSMNSLKGDWRTLSADEKRQIINILTVDEIVKKYNVGRSTAFAWKSKKQ